MWVMNLLRFGYSLAHAASDGKVTESEVLDALKHVFPDSVDDVLDQVKQELDDGGSIGVDDVIKIAAGFVY